MHALLALVLMEHCGRRASDVCGYQTIGQEGHDDSRSKIMQV